MILTEIAPRVLAPDEVRRIAESVLGPISWETDTSGICSCPGEELHSASTKKRDCQFYLDTVPTIFCHHASCAAAVDQANHRVRSAIGKARTASGCIGYRPTIQEQLLRGNRLRKKREKEQLARRSRESLALIIEQHSGSTADLWEASPIRLLDAPEDEWHLLLNLFNSDDIVWIGNTYDSANDDQDERKKAVAAMHFKTAGEWLDSPVPPAGPFICPCTFKEGSHSRCNANVQRQPFLVVESDELSHEHFIGVIILLKQSLRLRAVVDTAGKSLHAWFDYPTDSQMKELRTILPELKCDPAMFRPSQAVRLPGVRRYQMDHGSSVFMGIQALLYLDL